MDSLEVEVTGKLDEKREALVDRMGRREYSVLRLVWGYGLAMLFALAGIAAVFIDPHEYSISFLENGTVRGTVVVVFLAAALGVVYLIQPRSKVKL